MTSPYEGLRVALYARVSTDNTGQDATLQLPQLREIALARGYEIYGEYVDEASAKDANRPAWREVMDAASKHKIDAIMATKLDRIMRSVVQLNTTVDELQTCNVSLICLNTGEINPRTANGRLLMNFLGAIAEWEREIISARTSEGMQARIARGQKFGRKRRDDIPLSTVAILRRNGMGWSRISQELGIPKSTLIDRKSEIEEATKCLLEQGSEKVSPVSDGSEREGVL